MQVRVANRHMIYSEVLAALMSGAMGFGVMLSKGPVWVALSLQHDFLGIGYRIWIALPMVVFSLLLLISCALEWYSGRRWMVEQLRLNAIAREWSCLLLSLVNITMTIEVVRLSSFFAAPIVLVHAVILSLAFAFAAVKNRRLSVVLDDRIPTEQLRARLPNSW